MDLDALRALGPTIRKLLAKDAVALVWVTAPHLANAMMVIADWGLEYRSYRVWNKHRMACGYWVRSDCEIVLICTRGKPKAPKQGKQGRSIFEAPAAVKGHSAKPEILHEWVEEHYPDARKAELFARRKRDGWTAIGSDLGLLITADGIISI